MALDIGGIMRMNKLSKVAVVVPYYHSDLSELEKVSLSQCKKVLGKYPIILLVPEKISEEDLPNDFSYIYERVPDFYLESVSTYNKMMLSKEFYVRFSMYEYILIYQLDAIVFSDQLDAFCNLGYDYIGAPWIHGVRCVFDLHEIQFITVGNGGLSLRKISTFLQMLTDNDISIPYTNNFQAIKNEDVIWSSNLLRKDIYKVAPMKVALQFAFEQDVQKCYEMNHKKLPFGCHAWERFNFRFWKPYLEEMGYSIKTEIEGNADKGISDLNLMKKYIDASEELVKSSLNIFLNSKSKEIYVFGAGEVGRECIWLLRHAGIRLVSCIDNNKKIQGSYVWGVMVNSFDELKNQKKGETFIIIATNKYSQEIMKQLTEEGLRYKQNFILYKELTELILSKM